MTVRLALASAPVRLADRYGDFSGAANTEPSFGLACLAAVAMDAGADVRIVEAASLDLSVEEALDRILPFEPHVVGISATTVGIAAAGALAARLKSARPQVRVLVGGCHATAIPEQTLAEFPGFDMAVIGEGERTLVEILRAVEGGGAWPAVMPGTAQRRNGSVQVNPRRPLIPDLDTLPLPAWSLIEGFPAAFHPSPARLKRWPCASVVLTRGCPNRCTFCDRSVFGQQCRAYSPGYAVTLFLDLTRQYGVREILIEDDTFIISKPRVREFCERLIAEKAHVSWSCLGRADRVDPDLLRLMRKAGCWHISFGIESGDPAILESVNKRLDLGQVHRALHWSRAAGLRTKGFFMVGFPGETEDSLEATRAVVRTLPADDISVMQLTPFPGTEMYETADAFGALDRDWRKMNTLQTVFVPNGFTEADLVRARSRILRTFYRRPGVLFRHLLHAIARPRLLRHMLFGAAALMKVTKERRDDGNRPT